MPASQEVPNLFRRKPLSPLLRGTPDVRDVGLALYALNASELVNPELLEAEVQAILLLAVHSVEGYLEARDAIEVGRSFREPLIKPFKASNIWVEWLISDRNRIGVLTRG